MVRRPFTWSSDMSSSMPLNLPTWLLLGCERLAKTLLPFWTCRDGRDGA